MSVSEACSQMDCQLSKSPLPVIWVVETLARSTQVDVSILLDLLEKSPEIADNLGKNARELVFLRILESFLGHGAQSDSVSAASSPKIAFHPSESCEDVLQQILLKTPASNLIPAGPEMCKSDVQTFTAHKRSRLPTHALQQLKNAILTGSHSFPVSLKEQSGLLPPERGLEVDDNICNGVAPRFEVTETNTRQINESNNWLISPALANNSNLLQSEKLLPRKKRKKSTATENTAGNSSKKYILSRNGSKIRIKNLSKKYVLSRNGSKIRIKIINEHKDEVIVQHSEKEKCRLDKDANVGGIGLNETPRDEIIKECISSKEVPRFDTELPNEESGDVRGQEENEIIKAKCDLNSAEDVDKSEPSILMNVPIVYSQCRDSQDWGDLNMLADLCSKIVQSSEAQDCALEKRTNHEFTSSEGHFGPGEALHQETEALHRDTKMPDENIPTLVESEEEDDIAKKKNAFLEKYDWKEIKNVCVKCKRSGKLLVCSDKSCLVAFHELCLGSDASFSTGEKYFYCPFCEYSRAVTKYMEVKKKMSLARNDLVAFFCRDTGKESKKQYHTSSQVREKRNGIEIHEETRSKKRAIRLPEKDLAHKYKGPLHTDSADDREISEEKNEDSGASKYFIRVQKHEKQDSFSSLPHLRRKRHPWTTAEEEKLKEGIRIFYSPDDRVVPWKKIQEFGADVFHESRSTV
ncbi:hypothetical protein PHJA_001207500 [Phtheirospermum japonicum]|uniref:PHD-type domain-containing protein n=1 Tax=Phtheirospermum japonicum TaxID=374723 RepID=A0A830C2W0_9LAMI|nr:hypothetical protein PHJA_001207500 [Phtheirospermum japonicum]